LFLSCEWMKRLVMLLFSYAFLIATANNSATLSTLILGLGWRIGIVSQTTNSSIALFSIFAYALPLKTGCVHKALTLLAPFSLSNPAALESVPPVSQISSIRTMSLSVTSPITTMLAISFALFLCLSQITISALK
jgi:hypothetical protein